MSQMDEILRNYQEALQQQMGLILTGRHRLDIKTADKMLLTEPKQALKSLLLSEAEQYMAWSEDRIDWCVRVEAIPIEAINRLFELERNIE